HLYSNALESKNDHKIIANLKNKGFDNETYRRVDCMLLILNRNICLNCKILCNTLYKIEKCHTNSVQSVKTSHASREVLAELVQNTRKVFIINQTIIANKNSYFQVIKSQKKLVESLRDRLKKKFETEKEDASELLVKI